ncbi:MAG TPA: DUF1570 domain-containing protein [Planctomycetota bacterium]|jgi:tetratricopeptide (TPR) repeat protein|nr:DUF1570 domain-containing protein [Planctomycetota bacterium]
MGPILLLVAPLLGQTPAPASGRKPDPPRLARPIALLAEGKAEEAFAEAETALEFAPEDLDLLETASKAAEALGRRDEAFAYASIAADLAAEIPERKALLDALQRRLGALDPLQGKGATMLRDCAGTLFRLGEGCASRGLPANAVDLYGRCAGTPLDGKARAALDRLYAQRKVVESLLETGLDVPAKAGGKVSPERAAREDATHASWERAWEVKSPNYTAITNLPRSTAEQISSAMEQMNRFYRTVFRHKERGGGTARCVLRVYRTRAEFDRLEGSPAASVEGFYAPDDNRVSTYDPRSEGRPLSVLWETLFHESSHQFTHMISADLVPGWLNEGTASYFEGARLLPNGSVETNLVPDLRLLEAREALDQGKPTLRELVSFYEEGSYPGEYYGLGWALVYFLHNYEDEACERVYRSTYGDFLDAYRTGGKHDPFERFVSFFVKKAKQPGIESFEAFEGRFRRWVLDLFAIHFGPSEKAGVLVERSRKQRARGKREAAVESYRWALRKRPDDASALAELADVEAELKRRDAAVLHLRQAIAGSGASAGDPFVEGCIRKMAAIDKPLADGLTAAFAGMSKAAATTAEAYASAGFPRLALRVLQSASGVLGADPSLRARRSEIVRSTGVDGRRWRRLPIDEGLTHWEGAPEWKAEGEAVRGESKGPSFLFHRDEWAEPLRLEVAVRPNLTSEEAFIGIAFGANAETGITIFGVSKGGLVDVSRLEREWKTLRDFGPARIRKGVPLRLAVELSDEGAEFLLDGKSLGSLPLPARERRGQIGLVVQDAEAGFADVRVRS